MPMVGWGRRNQGSGTVPPGGSTGASPHCRGPTASRTRWCTPTGRSSGPAPGSVSGQPRSGGAAAGNCGSPIETDAGWLVLTHGVGPMRTYRIGAILLDLEHPERVIGRLRSPLLSPADDERDGYVPNVVYSCGALVHADTLVLPYGIADSAIGFATVPLPGCWPRSPTRTPSTTVPTWYGGERGEKLMASTTSVLESPPRVPRR